LLQKGFTMSFNQLHLKSIWQRLLAGVVIKAPSTFLRSRVIKNHPRNALLHASHQARLAAERSLSEGVYQLAERRPLVLSTILGLMRVVAPRHLGLAEMQAVLTARHSGWQKAMPLSDRMKGWSPDRPPALPRRILMPPRAVQTVRQAAPLDDRPIDLPLDLARRVVVYTACFGARPCLPPLIGQPEGLRFLCFTDVPVDVPGWEVVVTERPLGGESFAAICPHLLLSEAAPAAEWSLYIERSQIPLGNLHNLMTRWLLRQDMALWPHPAASDWQRLAEYLLLTGCRPAAAVIAQAAALEAADVPRDQGAYDTGMIWRRHSDAAIKAGMEAWWTLQKAEPEGNPALSFYRLTHEEGLHSVSFVQLPSTLGSAEKNIFFARNVPGIEALHPRLPSPGVLRHKVPITFLYAKQRRDAGITLMRARQLSKMVAAAYPDCYDVTLTSDIGSVRDQVVIVNRGAIEFNTLPHLAELRDRNVASISDWLDAPVQAKANPVFDAHMTLCLPQAVELNRVFPNTPAFHVTHHVNPDIHECTGPTDRLRTGYFGRLANTSRPESLATEIELVNVTDASFTAEDWAQKAPLYNCHWIIREMDHLQEWKPFLKAFVAARCGAVVIVTRDDMNAMHYLGDDYPYYADSLTQPDLEEAWARAASTFGSKDWQKAQAIMRQVKARSSDRQVMIEFKAMLDEILA
jgi:hypothetical protein